MAIPVPKAPIRQPVSGIPGNQPTLSKSRFYDMGLSGAAFVPSGNASEQGSFGELNVQHAQDYLNGLKDAIKSGKLPISDYFDLAEPAVKQAAQWTEGIAGAGSERASAVNPIWKGIVDSGFVKSQEGKYVAQVPFNSREYANLPNAIKPTQEEVDSGLLPIDLLPPNADFRKPEEPQPSVLQPLDGSTAQPPGVPDPTKPGQTIPVPLVGDPLSKSVPKIGDQSIIEAEARRQEEQNRLAFEAQRGLRQKRLDDLASLLASQEETKFNRAVPNIAEQANTAGILRSTGFGQALAKERTMLAEDTAARLGEQALLDREAEVSGIGDILGKRQSFQTTGLERRFSLDDFNRQVEAARSLGVAAAPSVPRGSGKGGNILSGALGGGEIGATAGGGPWGAAIGGASGAVLAALTSRRGKP